MKSSYIAACELFVQPEYEVDLGDCAGDGLLVNVYGRESPIGSRAQAPLINKKLRGSGDWLVLIDTDNRPLQEPCASDMRMREMTNLPAGHAPQRSAAEALTASQCAEVAGLLKVRH